MESSLTHCGCQMVTGIWVNIGSGNGLTAPSHYLKQYWLVTTEVVWYSRDGNFTADAPATVSNHEVSLKTQITAESTRANELNTEVIYG